MVMTALSLAENLTRLRKKKVLIADDDRDDLDLAAIEFKRLRGVTLSFATSGTEAVEMVEKSHYDLILLDNHLPGISGVEAAVNIRTIQPGVSIIICTGFISDSLTAAALSTGLPVMAKPLDIQRLKGLLSSLGNCVIDDVGSSYIAPAPSHVPAFA
jgi:CheY-like chemotaxis protein